MQERAFVLTIGVMYAQAIAPSAGTTFALSLPVRHL